MNEQALRVGWIGLGAIGLPMAQRVLQAGFLLQLWSRNPASAQALVEAGATRVDSPAALAQQVDVLALCVTDARAVEEVVFGPAGLALQPRPNLIIVDHSTIDPLSTRSLAERWMQCGGQWVDAPVSGGPAGAREARLTAFAGGADEAVRHVGPLLAAYAQRVTHLGPSGSGQAGKACNQLVSFGTAALLAESLHLAHRFGLDAARLVDAMQGGFADSAVLRHYAPALLSGRYAGSTPHAVKDMDIVLELGRDTATPLPLAGVLNSLYRMLLLKGLDDLGMAGVMRLYVDGALASAPVRAASSRPAQPAVEPRSRPAPPSA